MPALLLPRFAGQVGVRLIGPRVDRVPSLVGVRCAFAAFDSSAIGLASGQASWAICRLTTRRLSARPSARSADGAGPEQLATPPGRSTFLHARLTQLRRTLWRAGWRAYGVAPASLGLSGRLAVGALVSCCVWAGISARTGRG